MLAQKVAVMNHGRGTQSIMCPTVLKYIPAMCMVTFFGTYMKSEKINFDMGGFPSGGDQFVKTSKKHPKMEPNEVPESPRKSRKSPPSGRED